VAWEEKHEDYEKETHTGVKKVNMDEIIIPKGRMGQRPEYVPGGKNGI